MTPGVNNTLEKKPLASAAKQAPLVFVVDDEALIGEVVEIFLKMAGYRVRLFQDPEEAWKVFAAASPKPDLLITDFAMQPIDGMELIERCRSLKPGLKTILISGNVTENIIHEYSYKPNKFLPKPFQSPELLETVQAVLKS